MEKENFIIRGGGPAGLSSAITLLKRGYKCKLIEKDFYPKKMANRGFQVLENYTKNEDSLNLLKNLGVENFFYFPINKAVFWDFSFNPYPFFSYENFGYLIRRGDEEKSLDISLLERAKNLGLEISKENLKEDICATGPTQPDGIAQERHFKTDDKLRIWVLMDNKKINGGYSYLFTYGGKGTFGCAITYGFSKIRDISKKCWDFFHKVEKIPVEDLNIYHSYISFYIPEIYEKGNILYVGEAGGLQDFFLGMGIRIAIESGIIASNSLISKEPYTKKIKERFLNDLKRTFILRIIYEKIPFWLFNFLIKKYSRREGKKILNKITNLNFPNFLFSFLSLIYKSRKICVHPLKPHFCRMPKKI